MSSGGDIVEGISKLVKKIVDLLDTTTAMTIKGIAVELGLKDQLNEGVDGINRNLGDFDQWFKEIREPLQQIHALKSLIILLGSLMPGLGQIVESAGELANAGLGDVVNIPDVVEKTVNEGDTLLQKGKDLLDIVPTVEDVNSVQVELANLMVVVNNYRQEKISE